jgi:hypothetical protein
VSHNELSPPGLGRAFVFQDLALSRSFFEILMLGFRDLILAKLSEVLLVGSLFITLIPD